MAVNKIIYGAKTLVDLTSDTVTPDVLLKGVTAHNAKGEEIIGTLDLKQYILDCAYPVGTIYESVKNVSPQTFLGGTWVAFGAGRMTVSVNAGDTDFNAAEKTGGEKAVANVLPVHTHTFSGNGTASDSGGHQHSMYLLFEKDSGGGSTRNRVTPAPNGTSKTSPYKTETNGSHSHSVSVSGTTDSAGTASAGSTHNNMPPYITTYKWKRTV